MISFKWFMVVCSGIVVKWWVVVIFVFGVCLVFVVIVVSIN